MQTTTHNTTATEDRSAGRYAVPLYAIQRLVVAVIAALLAAVVATIGLAEPALAQGGGSSINIEEAARTVVQICVALILAIIFLRVLPDLGKKAYASIGILIVVGSIVYFLAQNPDSLDAIGRFFGEDILGL